MSLSLTSIFIWKIGESLIVRLLNLGEIGVQVAPKLYWGPSRWLAKTVGPTMDFLRIGVDVIV